MVNFLEKKHYNVNNLLSMKISKEQEALNSGKYLDQKSMICFRLEICIYC